MMGPPFDSGKKGPGARGQASSIPTPQSPLSKRGSSFRRNGSLGKGSSNKTTTPQRPMLATEARSLVRPCGCGKDGVFKAHGHSHDSHHRVPVTPERTIRESKTPRSPQVASKIRPTPPPQPHSHHHQKQPAQQQQLERQPSLPQHQPEEIVEPKAERQVTPPPPVQQPPSPSPLTKRQLPNLIRGQDDEESKPAKLTPPEPVLTPKTLKPIVKSSKLFRPSKPIQDNGYNRFVSTVVWYPEQQPEFNSTTLNLLPGEDSTRYVDEILVKEYDSYVKKMFPDSESKLQDETMYSKQIISRGLTNNTEGGSLVPPKMRINPVSVS